MRIISGKYKSRRFQLPTNFTARPTTDFARESLFNILNNRIEWEETDALDLFSGTGSIAIEMVSRGCKHVVSVESSAKNHAFIEKVKEKLDAKELLTIKANVFSFIKSCNQSFDLIFADPPYNLEDLSSIPTKILELNLLKPNGIFIIEHSKKNTFTDHPLFIEERKYGNVHFSFFSKES
ncbi:MAG TPA: 16S rRNA (guanine(966)-N(2))-methyltransferase RsmD [Dysgonamonadaceae bacterium]|nr:16S rRNA (guanine(966)-N(2))-methyltransferase RsmD [Dysgonamonadaceae bacterium]